jgi:hypothetical protein
VVKPSDSCDLLDRLVLFLVQLGMQQQLYSSKGQTLKMGLQLKKPLIAHYFKSRCSMLLSLFELVLFFKCFCFLVMWA